MFVSVKKNDVCKGAARGADWRQRGRRQERGRREAEDEDVQRERSGGRAAEGVADEGAGREHV